MHAGARWLLSGLTCRGGGGRAACSHETPHTPPPGHVSHSPRKDFGTFSKPFQSPQQCKHQPVQDRRCLARRNPLTRGSGLTTALLREIFCHCHS
jgi:hypothetical protein